MQVLWQYYEIHICKWNSKRQLLICSFKSIESILGTSGTPKNQNHQITRPVTNTCLSVNFKWSHSVPSPLRGPSGGHFTHCVPKGTSTSLELPWLWLGIIDLPSWQINDCPSCPLTYDFFQPHGSDSVLWPTLMCHFGHLEFFLLTEYLAIFWHQNFF